MPSVLFVTLVIVASLASQELLPAPVLRPADASQVAETPALETSGLTAGDHIKALTSQGEWIAGRFEGLRGGELILSTPARAVVLHQEQLWEVRAKGHRPRPIVRYFLKGMLLGALVSVSMLVQQGLEDCNLYCTPDDERLRVDEAVAISTFFGMVGGVIGGFTTHTPERVIYARSSVSSAPPAGPRLAFRLSRRF